jgi:hypothetical protein
MYANFYPFMGVLHAFPTSSCSNLPPIFLHGSTGGETRPLLAWVYYLLLVPLLSQFQSLSPVLPKFGETKRPN